VGLVTAARDAIAAQNPKPLPHFFSWATREVETRGSFSLVLVLVLLLLLTQNKNYVPP
jgi:hypothetical protein